MYNESNLQYILTICLYPLFGHFVVDMTDFMADLTALLSKYKKVYFLSYQFILSFDVVVNKCNVFVRLMYKGIHQTSYKYKFFMWSKHSDFDKVIPPLLYDLYEKCNQELIEDKPVLKGILKTQQTPKKTVTFQLTPIKEDISESSKWTSPLQKYTHSVFHSHLMDPRSPHQ